MKKILTLVFSKPLILILIISLVIYFPSLHTGWSFVDDGLSAAISSKLTEAFSRIDVNSFVGYLLEPSGSGRFMPFYWVYLWFTFLISGYGNPFWQHLIQLVMFISFISVFYLFVYKLFSNKWLSALSSILLVTNVIAVQDWYRLGPQEARLTFFILLYLFLWFIHTKTKKAFYLVFSLLFLVFTFLMKETSVVLIPFIFLIIIYQLVIEKQKFKKSFVSVLNLIFAVFLGLIVIKLSNNNTGYASNYAFSVKRILSNFIYLFNLLREGYFPLLETSFVVFILRLYNFVKKKDLIEAIKSLKYDLFAICFFLTYVLVISPWSFTLDRYLLPGICALFVFISSQLVWIFKQKFYLAKLLRFLIVISLVFSLTYQMMQSLSYIKWVMSYNKMMTGLDISLNQIFESNSLTHFYLNVDNGGQPLEIYDEITQHMMYFYGNKNISLSYLPKDYQPKINDFVISANGQEIVNENSLLNNHLMVLAKENVVFTNYSIINPYLFYRNLPKVAIDLVFHKNNSTLLIGTYYSYFWKIYAYKN